MIFVCKRFLVFFLSAGAMLLLQGQAYSQTPPVFTSTPVTTGVYGSPYSYLVETTDADGDTRTISTLSVLPGGLTLVDNGDGTAQLSGSPTEVGDFPIVVTVQETSGALEPMIPNSGWRPEFSPMI